MSKVNISQLNQLDIGYGVPWYNIEKQRDTPYTTNITFPRPKTSLNLYSEKNTKERETKTKALTVQVFQTPHLKVGQGYEWTGPA